MAYIDSWLSGVGAAVDNLMEGDMAGRDQPARSCGCGACAVLPMDRYATVRDEELERLGGPREGRLKDAWDVLDRLVLDDDADFLALRAYAVTE